MTVRLEMPDWISAAGVFRAVLGCPPPHLDQMGLGPRTPALIISPFTRTGVGPQGGYVDHTTYEFSSVLRLVEDVFDVPTLTERDAQASPLAGAFDFDHPNFEPLVLPLRTDCPYGTTTEELDASLKNLPRTGSVARD